MSNEKKSDYNEFHAFIDELQNFSWLEPSQKWWPKFIFHFTNIDNAIKILEDGKLLSRSQLEQTLGMQSDNASPDVLSLIPIVRFQFIFFLTLKKYLREKMYILANKV